MSCLHDAGGRLELQDIYHQLKIGHYWGVKEEDLGESFGQPRFTHEIRSALNVLKKEGYVENLDRGVWALSDVGHRGMTNLARRLHEVTDADRQTVLDRWEDIMKER
jgi:hypothetical protein